ncbi:OLC1v1017932C1 [Oldenlandia corymbosa var. corymbosa]|uniref:OLC1v1017932C1 n=1 Tax=Oldenlandia corymbosa var. corymbosa TaxID=529605 RepID=A0AAV1EAJ2_OLDCO|nr:OLC1v1017932C1 [Oldenlandia corymbosa var. corymbosa]
MLFVSTISAKFVDEMGGETMASEDHQRHHVSLFPFMAKGHTIPFLHLARLLVGRNATVTFFTIPSNQTFVTNFLSDLITTTNRISIISLPFPAVDGAAASFPEIPVWIPTHDMKPHFETSLETLRDPPLTFMVTDDLFLSGVLPKVRESEDEDQPFSVPGFSWLKLSSSDIPPTDSDSRQTRGFLMDCAISSKNSFGYIVNSFYELEPAFADSMPKAWPVEPLCLVGGDHNKAAARDDRESTISGEQLQEIKIGLEKSGVNFLWVVRNKKHSEIISGDDGFEERVASRGLVVREWVDQREILGHESVQGLTNCGWNSVCESVCAKVPILAWPMMADQLIHARLVAQEIN